MGQKSGQASDSRVPPAWGGIEINCCARVNCDNFQKPPCNQRSDPYYTISGAKGDGQCLKCRSCEGYYGIKSNRAVFEEIKRLEYRNARSQVYRQDGVACHNTECEGFGVPVNEHPNQYKRIGKTPAQNQRFQCKLCGTRFTQGSHKRASHPANKSHLNTPLFKALCNKVVNSRISEILDLSPPTIRRKIDMFFERSTAFLHAREKRLQDMTLVRMRLSTDRQEYIVNWTARKDKRNVILSAIGTADMVSGYVFGMDVNFDPAVNLWEVETSEGYHQDTCLKPFNRRHARLWTSRDYKSGVQASYQYKQKVNQLLQRYASSDLPIPLTNAGLSYALDQLSEESGLDAQEHSMSTQLPDRGCQVHLEYTMYAHFQRLSRLIGHAWQLRFYLDQEAGINRALSAAFSQRILEGDCHALYVAINKELNVDQRRALVSLTDRQIKRLLDNGFVRTEQEAKEYMVTEQLDNPITYKGRPEDWFHIPINYIYECEKHVAFITDEAKLDQRDRVSIMLDASLHPIDRFFMLVRRRLSVLERPIHARSNTGSVWTGYNPYDPSMIEKYLQMMRLYYNYCLKGKDGKTPAQRLGLAKGPVELRKIL